MLPCWSVSNRRCQEQRFLRRNMAFYTGPSYSQDQVSIESPDLSLLQSSSIDSNIKDSMEHWISEAQSRDDILYFSIWVIQVTQRPLMRHRNISDLSNSLYPSGNLNKFDVQCAHLCRAIAIAPRKVVSYPRRLNSTCGAGTSFRCSSITLLAAWMKFSPLPTATPPPTRMRSGA